MRTGEHTQQPENGLTPFLYLVSFLGGPLALLPFLYKLSGTWYRVWTLFAAPVPVLLWLTLPIGWSLLALAVVAWHAFYTVTLILALPPRRGHHNRLHAGERLRMAILLTAAALPSSLVVAGLQQWLIDAFWSTYLPVNFDVGAISREFGMQVGVLALLVPTCALHLARTEERFTVLRMGLALGIFYGIFIWSWQSYLLVSEVPRWQLIQAGVFPDWVGRIRQILFFVLVFLGVSLLGGSVYSNIRMRQPFLRMYLSGLLTFSLALVGLGMATGSPVHYVLLLGRQYEKEGITQKTIPWYAKALQWSPTDRLKSYLQFRVALLHHKNGDSEEAEAAFVRVLVKYYHDADVLLKAHEFKDKLEAGGRDGARRVVIPGVEARTEYKAAYCVPNSLGLVLNFWGDNVGAKRIGAEITQLGSGSFITDEAFYAESRGFRHFVLSLRSLDDIKRLIDHNIPVLAFIPGHVLAVFGYDEVLQTVITYDVNTYDIWDEQRWEEFQDSWAQDFNTLGIVVPEEKVPLVQELLGEGIEEQNQAYLHYMIGLLKNDAGEKVAHFDKARNHGLFFADWLYQYFVGEPPGDRVPDSSIADFLLDNHVYESQVLNYLRSLYQRGDYETLIAFLEQYQEANTLSGSQAILLAGAYSRRGQAGKAVEVLLTRTDLEELSTVAVEYLLKHPLVVGNPTLANQMSERLLNTESGMTGQGMRRALRVWLATNEVDYRNINEALNALDTYLNGWNPYDAEAIRFLLSIYPIKKFRKDDDLNRKLWQKRIAAYSDRLEVLEFYDAP